MISLFRHGSVRGSSNKMTSFNQSHNILELEIQESPNQTPQ